MSADRLRTALLFANTDWYLYNFRLPLARAMRDAGYDVHLVSPGGPYAERLAAGGFTWHRFDFERKGMNPAAEAATLVRLARLYRAVRPHVVHHFTIKCVLYGSIAARLAGTPRVVNAITGLGHVFVHGSRRIGLVRTLVLALYRLALRGTDVVFQNDDDRSAFAQAGLLRDTRVHLIRGSGVDVDRFRPTPTPNAADTGTALRLLFASRLLREKGVRELVEAARILAQRKCPVEVVVAGAPDPGNPSSFTGAELGQWSGEANVRFVGQRDDIPSLLSHTDVAVLPSYREGTPRILLEAAACGLPLIATDVPGCREIVKHDDNGILVNARDPVALANAIERLAREPETRQRMGRRSREIACGEFSEAKVLAATLSIYDLPAVEE